MATRIDTLERPRAVTSKGLATRAKILETAYDVFKIMGYHGASISEIARRLNLSMGTFYRYFRNKEQVFMELNDSIITGFMEKLAAAPLNGPDFKSRLTELVRMIYQHTAENFAFHSVLGESELVDRVTVSYYESIARFCRDFFRRESAAGTIRSLDPNAITYGIIGMCYFNSMQWGEEHEAYDPRRVVDLIAELLINGVSGPAEWEKAPGWDSLSIPETRGIGPELDSALTKGELTRRSILLAAGKVFGKHGVNHANIAEITRLAGVAQGTFYIYFKSRSELIESFVKYINRRMRGEIQNAVAGIQDRRDVEWMGMLAFFNFILRHWEIYRIVPEYELSGGEISLWYYTKIVDGYIVGIEQGISKKQIRDFPPTFLARSLMGFSHFIGLKWIVWAGDPKKLPNSLFKDIRDLILFGLCR